MIARHQAQTDRTVIEMREHYHPARLEHDLHLEVLHEEVTALGQPSDGDERIRGEHWHALYMVASGAADKPIVDPPSRMERVYLDGWRAHGVVIDAERCAREMVPLATHRLLWMLSWIERNRAQ